MGHFAFQEVSSHVFRHGLVARVDDGNLEVADRETQVDGR
jgi:hypothetical protein